MRSFGLFQAVVIAFVCVALLSCVCAFPLASLPVDAKFALQSDNSRTYWADDSAYYCVGDNCDVIHFAQPEGSISVVFVTRLLTSAPQEPLMFALILRDDAVTVNSYVSIGIQKLADTVPLPPGCLFGLSDKDVLTLTSISDNVFALIRGTHGHQYAALRFQYNKGGLSTDSQLHLLSISDSATKLKAVIGAFEVFFNKATGSFLSAVAGVAMSPEFVRQCGTPLVITHDGTFHTDDVLACEMVKTLPAYKDARILRTRDLEEIAASNADFVLDVGGKYDPAANLFDHHQFDFAETYNERHRVKLSSSGLFWKHYGLDVVNELWIRRAGFQSTVDLENTPVTRKVVADYMYARFFETIDAEDNGIDSYSDSPNYSYPLGATLGTSVFYLSLSCGIVDHEHGQENFDRARSRLRDYMNVAFDAAYNYAAKKGGFTDALLLTSKTLNDASLPNFQESLSALRKGDSPTPSVFFLDEAKKIVLFLTPQPFEECYSELRGVFLVVHRAADPAAWVVRAVPKRVGTFETKVTLPRSAEEAKGFSDVFVTHSTGSHCMTHTLLGAMDLAYKTCYKGGKQKQLPAIYEKLVALGL